MSRALNRPNGKKDLSSKQPRSNANMEARMDAMMIEMAAMNAAIRSSVVGANSVPSDQGRL